MTRLRLVGTDFRVGLEAPAPKHLKNNEIRGGSFLMVHWGVETKMGGIDFFRSILGGKDFFRCILGGYRIFSFQSGGGTDLFTASLYSYFSNLRMSHFKHLRG